MVLIVGVLVALLGLGIVGTSSNSIRRRRNYRLPIGFILIAAGALFAMFGGQALLMMGWGHP
jgi:hypothetical protein